MLTISRFDIYNFENALRGARNAKNSWDKIDSSYDEKGNYIYGENDLKLLMNLCSAGSDHRKFMRQIFVSVDIHAPLYWWKEFDTYKVGTAANSTSTMHKIHAKPFDMADFSVDKLDGESMKAMEVMVDILEKNRLKFVETKNKDYWYNIIQLLPSSYNQLRTCSMNYENLSNMYHARKNHKLSEWHIYCDWIASLPYAKELIIRA